MGCAGQGGCGRGYVGEGGEGTAVVYEAVSGAFVGAIALVLDRIDFEDEGCERAYSDAGRVDFA